MRLEHEGRVEAPPARVWAILMDVPRAARLVPGLVSVEAVDPPILRSSRGDPPGGPAGGTRDPAGEALARDRNSGLRQEPARTESEPKARESYRGTLRVQVGPVRLDLAGSVEIAARDEAARTATMRLDAADPRLGGSVRATLELALTPADGGATAVRMVTEAQVLGRIGELGQPVIRRKADQIVARFLADLSREAAEA